MWYMMIKMYVELYLQQVPATRTHIDHASSCNASIRLHCGSLGQR